ncbi:MAG: hypothetical protein OXC03_00135 [Flavobacteriaceae bacterium]|nr:hypothetical protein [Flavobacteriaceae bacterium]
MACELEQNAEVRTSLNIFAVGEEIFKNNRIIYVSLTITQKGDRLEEA